MKVRVSKSGSQTPSESFFKYGNLFFLLQLYQKPIKYILSFSAKKEIDPKLYFIYSIKQYR